MKRRTALGLAAGSALAGLTGLATAPRAQTSSAGKLVIRVATGTAPDHPENVGSRRFKDLLEASSKGTIEVQVHAAGELGSQRDFVEALRSGTLEVTMVTIGFFSAYDPLLNIFEMPYLFRDGGHAFRVVDGPIGAQIAERVNKKNVHLLAYWEAGLRDITNNVRPIVKPDDLKGLKIRVPEQKVSIDAFKVFGANPAPLAFTELYMALKQGVFDGQENPPSNVYASKLYEAQKYLSLSGHQFLVHMFMYSGPLWEKLPADTQKLIAAAAIEAGTFQRAFNDEQDVKLVASLKQVGMQVNEVDKQAFMDKAKPMYAEYAKTYGAEAAKFIEAVQAVK
jgi:tripartite ATP-independent transporter DctP family solute receptor